MRAAIAFGLLASCGLAGCFTSLQEDAGVESPLGPACVSANCRRGSAGGSGSSSSGATSEAGGTTSGSSSSGASSGEASSSGSSSSSGAGTPDGGPDCPELYVASTVSDIAAQTPIAGVTITALGLDGVPIAGASASSDATGYFALCVPANTEFSLEATAQGYPETILEDAVLLKSETFSFGTGGMPLLSQSDLTALNALVPFNPNMGTMLVSVNSVSKAPLCYDSAGWTVALAFPDGGSLPDGGGLPYQRVYLSNEFLPDPTLTATDSQGDTFFYDIDTNATDRVAIIAANTNTNAASCPNISAQIGLQGTALVEPQALTFAPVLNP
jgi:hypothetical protein